MQLTRIFMQPRFVTNLNNVITPGAKCQVLFAFPIPFRIRKAIPFRVRKDLEAKKVLLNGIVTSGIPEAVRRTGV